MSTNFSELANFCWSVADLLRGDYKQADYGKVILPFTLLRRLDCVLEPTKKAILAEHAKRKDSGIKDLAPFLLKKSGQSFYNTSRFSLPSLLDDSKHIRQNLLSFAAGANFLNSAACCRTGAVARVIRLAGKSASTSLSTAMRWTFKTASAAVADPSHGNSRYSRTRLLPIATTLANQ